MQIRLTDAELELLSRLHLWSVDTSQVVRDVKGIRTEMSERDADDLRDRLVDQLTASGFDQDYEPTMDGRILEALIDKLTCRNSHAKTTGVPGCQIRTPAFGH
jgi:hypothetical protein